MPEPIYIKTGALFDETRAYRYSLYRQWASDGPTVCWIMLNPSTADAERLDPTIRRCVNFSIRWGFSALSVVNLFAFRSTDPAALAAAADPVGPFNQTAILFEARAADRVVLAWGSSAPVTYRRQGERVRAWLAEAGVGPLFALGRNADGEPKHPLYLSSRLGLRIFEWERV